MFDIDASAAAFRFGAGALATGIATGLLLVWLSAWLQRRAAPHWFKQWEGRCRICGCDDLHACSGADGLPCHWAEPDLCSECATAGGDISAGPPLFRVTGKPCPHCNGAEFDNPHGPFPRCRACGWTPAEPAPPFPDASAGATHIGADYARGPSRTVTHTATAGGAAMPARPRKGGLS